VRLAPSILLAASLAASPSRAAGLAVESFELSPGTTAALVEDHRAPIVSLVVELPVGSWSPWGRKTHALEAFEMQRFDPGGSLRAEADRLGAELSTDSDERAVRLTASCLKDDLPGLLALVRKIFANRDLDSRELKRRKTTQGIEWKASEKEPFFVARQAAARLLFAAGDPRRLVVEKPEPVSTDPEHLAATRDAVLRLPGRAVGFAGDLTRAEVERLAAGLLPDADAKAPADLAPVFLPLAPEEQRKDVVVPLPRLTQVYFGYGRDSIPTTDPDYPAFVVADHVLGGHFYSRLYVALRHEGGETYGAGSRSEGDVVIGPYGMGTFTRTANTAVTEAKLREVLRVFHEKGITEEERADAAGYLRGQRAFGRQSPAQVLSRFLTERRLGLPEGFFDRLAERAASLPLDDIDAFIARFYAPERFSMVKVAPEK